MFDDFFQILKTIISIDMFKTIVSNCSPEKRTRGRCRSMLRSGTFLNLKLSSAAPQVRSSSSENRNVFSWKKDMFASILSCYFCKVFFFSWKKFFNLLDIFAGNYSVYGFEMQLSRSLGPFILSIYLPSAMFVTMSWVAFFVPPDIVPARIVLLVTLCLVLVNMFNSTTWAQF